MARKFLYTNTNDPRALNLPRMSNIKSPVVKWKTTDIENKSVWKLWKKNLFPFFLCCYQIRYLFIVDDKRNKTNWNQTIKRSPQRMWRENVNNVVKNTLTECFVSIQSILRCNLISFTANEITVSQLLWSCSFLFVKSTPSFLWPWIMVDIILITFCLETWHKTKLFAQG